MEKPPEGRWQVRDRMRRDRTYNIKRSLCYNMENGYKWGQDGKKRAGRRHYHPLTLSLPHGIKRHREGPGWQLPIFDQLICHGIGFTGVSESKEQGDKLCRNVSRLLGCLWLVFKGRLGNPMGRRQAVCKAWGPPSATLLKMKTAKLSVTRLILCSYHP